jgi:hypothetical protein
LCTDTQTCSLQEESGAVVFAPALLEDTWGSTAMMLLVVQSWASEPQESPPYSQLALLAMNLQPQPGAFLLWLKANS